jgi:chaperonin GroEL
VPGSSSQGVFLSYRREDAAPYARLLKSELRERIPAAQVFMDLDSIEAGLDFADVIRDALESCAVLVALIGRQWVTIADDGGNRRLDNPDDFVRFEVQTALERGVRVIPVLVDGATPLRQQQLPAELQKLARLNAFELSYGRYEYDATRLLDLIGRALAAVSVPAIEPADMDRGGGEISAPKPATPPMSRPAADRIAQGISSVTELIARTLGPMGRTSVLQDQAGNDIEAFDADMIVEHFVPDDPRETLGVTYVREMVREQHQVAHDGAATAAVLARAMTTRVMAELQAGANPIALKRGIQAGVERVAAELSALAIDVETKEQLVALAHTCTADATLGEMVAEAWNQVGRDGVITVEESSTLRPELELTEGMRFDQGYLSAQFVTDTDRAEAVLGDPYILIARSKIRMAKDLLPVLEKVAESGEALLIIAEDVEGEALATLAVNKVRGLLKSVAVKAPGASDRAIYGDIAILTGGQAIAEEIGLKLEDTGLDRLGRARKVVVTKDETTIIDGAGDADAIMGRINQIRTEIDDADSDYSRAELQQRLARLAGGVAVIRIGPAAEAAPHQRMKLAESAVVVTREAISRGLLSGGGSALLDVQHRLKENAEFGNSISSLRPDEKAGIAVVLDSLAEPLKRVMANAGWDPARLAHPISAWEAGTGFDVIANKTTDMQAAGIIDSCAVVSHAVANAASLTQRLLLAV